MPEPRHTLKVFLSYASQDKPVVRELSGRLASEGWVDPWIDEKKLLPGQDWRTKIEEAVESSDIVIVCLSGNSVSKEGFVQKELRYAREIAFEKPDETIFLIPLRLDDCTVPRGLRFYQWGDYFGENKEETYDALLESLKLRHEQKLKLEAEEHTRKEKAERERIALEEKARKEAEEKERLEEAERTRQERDEQERKAIEANEQKKSKENARREAEERTRIQNAEKERKAVELALQEKKKLEAAQKAKREKAEREAAERAVQEKLKRDAAEKSKREKLERQTAQIATVKKAISNSLVSLKLNLLKAVPFLRIVGFAGIAIALFWIGSWEVPKLISLIPTAKSSLTPKPSLAATFTFTSSPQVPTQTQLIPTSTETPILPTPIPTYGIGSTMISPKDGMILIFVPAGEFIIGEENGEIDEKPLNTVYLNSFWIDQTEVTNTMYARCVKDGECNQPTSSKFSTSEETYYGNFKFGNYPVVYISWNYANDYCKWADRRLPTEAEWEKAARGTDNRRYPWGSKIDYTFANYNNSVGGPTQVGSYPNGTSFYGALDMAGNAAEWVSSLYQSYPYNATDGREDMSASGYRVIRGGTWSWRSYYVRSAFRKWVIPSDAAPTIGFRCARSVP